MSSIAQKIEKMLSNDSVSVGSEAVAKAMVRHNEKQAEALSNAIANALSRADNFMKNQVSVLRSSRREEKRIKAHLVKVSRAVEYFKETGNPIPLSKFVDCYSILHVLGESTVGLDKSEFEIPADWTPEEK